MIVKYYYYYILFSLIYIYIHIFITYIYIFIFIYSYHKGLNELLSIACGAILFQLVFNLLLPSVRGYNLKNVAFQMLPYYWIIREEIVFDATPQRESNNIKLFDCRDQLTFLKYEIIFLGNFFRNRIKIVYVVCSWNLVLLKLHKVLSIIIN